jgi:hypothetical protein
MKELIGKKVTNVRQLTWAETNELGFTFRPTILEFEGGLVILPLADEEMNDAGVILLSSFSATKVINNRQSETTLI